MLRWRVAAKTKTLSKRKVEVLRAAPLGRIPWLVHGFSTRNGGISKLYGGSTLNLGYTRPGGTALGNTANDSKLTVASNRKAFAEAVIAQVVIGERQPKRRTARHSDTWPLVTVRQIHSDLVHGVSKIPGKPLVGDGLITRTPGLLLAVLAADCLPVIVVDTRLKAVGVFHAGWRGTLKRIVEKGIGEMRREFGSRPRDLRAAIGPGIRGCCYQVGVELRDKFSAQFSYAASLFRETKESDQVRERYPLLFLTARAPGHSELPKKIFLDLAEANRRQLIAAGLLQKNISDLGLCTSCRTDLFFSHRAEKGVTGRMMAAVGIRGDAVRQPKPAMVR